MGEGAQDLKAEWWDNSYKIKLPASTIHFKVIVLSPAVFSRARAIYVGSV